MALLGCAAPLLVPRSNQAQHIWVERYSCNSALLLLLGCLVDAPVCWAVGRAPDMLLSGADRGVPEGDCVLELLLLAVPWSSVSRSPLLMTCIHRQGMNCAVGQ
jgi:hypothetical protein